MVLGNCCIFRGVTDSRGSSKCIQIKLDRSKHTYIQHSRGSIGKNAGLVPMLKKKSILCYSLWWWWWVGVVVGGGLV